jgi:hypothetical protein
MLKVTKDNVTKMHLDRLYEVLEAETNQESDIAILVQAEIDRRHHIEDRAKFLKREMEAKKSAEQAAIEAEIRKIFETHSGQRMVMLVERLGGQFEDDYYICPTSFTVYSHVAREDQNSVWHHSSMEAASKKRFNLIYDRIYHYYMRNTSMDSLEVLRSTLAA